MGLILFVGMGGFVGAISRFLLSAWVQKSMAMGFPFGTLFVNTLGGFLIGFLALYFQEHSSSATRAFIIPGFLGALTTFSTFSYESVMLLEESAYVKAMGNVLVNLIFSLSATFLGMMLYKKLFL